MILKPARTVGSDLGDLGTENYGVVVPSSDRLGMVASGESGIYEPTLTVNGTISATMIEDIPRSQGKGAPTWMIPSPDLGSQNPTLTECGGKHTLSLPIVLPTSRSTSPRTQRRLNVHSVAPELVVKIDKAGALSAQSERARPKPLAPPGRSRSHAQWSLWSRWRWRGSAKSCFVGCVKSSGVLEAKPWEEKVGIDFEQAVHKLTIRYVVYRDLQPLSLRPSFERIMERNADEESSWEMGLQSETEILFWSRLEGAKTLRGAVTRPRGVRNGLVTTNALKICEGRLGMVREVFAGWRDVAFQYLVRCKHWETCARSGEE